MTSGGLAAYLVDPLGVGSPVLLATEAGAATLRVCDISADARARAPAPWPTRTA